jgi:hypothetical protein
MMRGALEPRLDDGGFQPGIARGPPSEPSRSTAPAFTVFQKSRDSTSPNSQFGDLSRLTKVQKKAPLPERGEGPCGGSEATGG